MPLNQREARLAIRKILAAEMRKVDVPAFVDMCVMTMAIEAYKAVGSSDPERVEQGLAIIRRGAMVLEDGFQQLITPLGERSDAGALKTLINRAAGGSIAVQTKYRAELFLRMFPWLQNRGSLFQDVFSGRATRPARMLAAAAKEEAPAARLRALAGIPLSPAGVMARRWIGKAAEDVGAPVPATAALQADAETVADAAAELGRVQRAIDVGDPMAEETADLQTRRDALTAQIEEVANTSEDPNVVRATAATTAANTSTSKVARRFGLTQEQEQVVLTRGKVVVAAGAGSGKCVARDTLLRTGAGILAIGALDPGLGEDEDAPLQEFVFGQNGPEQSSHFYRDGFRDTIRITTRQGYSLEGTRTHPILVLREAEVVWVPLGELAEGDHVCIDRRPGFFAETPFRVTHVKSSSRWQGETAIPEVLTSQVASLLGYLVSEGRIHVGPHCDISMTTADPEQWGLYQAALDGLVKWTPDTDERDGQRIARFHRNVDAHALLDFGLTPVLAHEKSIPEGILQSPRPIIRAFLRALFDGDGSISGCTVSYGTASPVLAKQLHVLLLSFGIVSKLRFKPNAHRGSWDIDITGDNLRMFTREIGFNLTSKQNAAERLLEVESNPNVDVVPGLSGICRAVHEAYKTNTGDARSKHPKYGTFKGYWDGSRNPSLPNLRAFVGAFEADCPEWVTLNALADLPWFYDPIDQIETSQAEVCDLVVPGTHSFSAGGFICHNTQTLVATIAHLVEEEGLNPSQILACSFTRAASAELGERVEKAGIQGADIGTTHSVARAIIKRNRPNLVQVVGKTKEADRLFKMAMKQIGMSLAKQQEALAQNQQLIDEIESVPRWMNNDFLSSLHGQLSRGKTLSDKQIAALKRFTGGRRWASDNSDHEVVVRIPPKVAAPPGKGGVSPYWTQPVGEWFNIGVTTLVNSDGKPAGEKWGKLQVENLKNARVSVDQARQERGESDPIAALYGAYEWLKRNDPVDGPAMDYTDQLIVALEILQNDPLARDREQRRYKAIMVDEAQDLNDVQFSMFRILGEQADTLSFIGDDKQSIYAFRGAKPSNYVDLSRSADFKTRLMTMNFRSGSAIVDAANKLIAHNEDRQIPMVCRADEKKGIGAIQAKGAPTHEAAASLVAQEIKDSIAAGSSAKDFGILVRNNAEADMYTLALLTRGVPYRMLKKSEGGYFGRPVVRSMVSWMRIAIGGSNSEVNDAIVAAHMSPGFGLDKVFAANLARRARGSFLDYIVQGGEVYDGQSAWMNKRVAEYATAIRRVKDAGTENSASLIREILSLKGAKGTFEDSLLAMVDEEDLVEESDGEVTEEAKRAAALAPLRPLNLMADHFKDPANLLGFIDKMKAANERTQKKTPEDKEDWKEPAVLIGTVHGWKGLQAKHCYVSMPGGVFPNFRSDTLAAKQEAEGVPVTAYDEERRLAYVALTRGEETVTVMSPQVNYLGKPSTLSQFVSEACLPVSGLATGSGGSNPGGEVSGAVDAEEEAMQGEADNARYAKTNHADVSDLISCMDDLDENGYFGDP